MVQYEVQKDKFPSCIVKWRINWLLLNFYNQLAHKLFWSFFLGKYHKSCDFCFPRNGDNWHVLSRKLQHGIYSELVNYDIGVGQKNLYIIWSAIFPSNTESLARRDRTSSLVFNISVSRNSQSSERLFSSAAEVSSSCINKN